MASTHAGTSLGPLRDDRHRRSMPVRTWVDSAAGLRFANVSALRSPSSVTLAPDVSKRRSPELRHGREAHLSFTLALLMCLSNLPQVCICSTSLRLLFIVLLLQSLQFRKMHCRICMLVLTTSSTGTYHDPFWPQKCLPQVVVSFFFFGSAPSGSLSSTLECGL